MKKILFSIFASIALGASAGTVTVTVLPNTMTNLLASFPGSVYVSQIIASAPTTNNATAFIYDTPTNTTVYTLPAYTNISYYATNYYVMYTNYYGAVQYSYTNTALIRYTNSIAGSTNSYPLRLVPAVLAGTSVTYGYPLNTLGYYFDNGIWATNGSSGNISLTITYR